MLMHPDFMLTLANQRQRELIAEAERRHLLRNTRAARWGRRAPKAPAVRGRPDGSLAPCEPSVAVPAR